MSPVDGDLLSERLLPAARGAGEASIDVGDLYKAVACRLRLLPPCLALTLALAGAYIYLTPTRYTATMSMLVDTRGRPPIGVDALSAPQNADVALVESQMRLISSNAVLKRVVENERLQFDPDYMPSASPSIITSIKRMLFGAQRDLDTPVDKVVDVLSKSVTTKRSEKSYVIDVEVKAPTRERAMRLGHAIAAAYVEIQSKLGDDIADKESVWINRRVAELRTRVEEAERHAEDYRKAQALRVTDGRLLPEQQLKDANTALIGARGKRAELESKFEQLKSAMHDGGSIESLNEVIHSPLIEKLRSEYSALSRDEAYTNSTLGPRHPSYQTNKAQIAALRTQINAELKRIAIAQERDLKAARNAEKAADRLVGDLGASTARLGGRKLELNELERQAAALRERYEKVLAARENVHRDVVTSPNGVLIDQPWAEKGKTSPRTLPALIIAFAGGFNLWIASALFAEYLKRRRANAVTSEPLPASSESSNDREPRFEEDGSQPVSSSQAPREASAGIDDESDTPFFVELPDISVKSEKSGGSSRRDLSDVVGLVRRAMGKRNGAYRNAICDVYDALRRRLAEDDFAPVVAIASSESGAGVSTVALSLAHVGCARGERILLIDGDPRNSTLTTLLDGLTPAKTRADDRHSLYVYERNDEDIGEILMTSLDGRRANWPLNESVADRFDLFIVDCGVLRDDRRLVPPTEEFDALLLVERGAPDREHLENLLDDHDLDDRCVGIVSAPTRLKRVRTGT